MSRHFQVIIIGGGPAGISAAIHLSRLGVHACVVMDDVANSGVAAEVLAPEAQLELRQLNLPDSMVPENSISCHGIEAWWGSSAPTFYSYIQNPLGNAAVVGRRQFHQLLLSRARDGVPFVLRGHFRGAEAEYCGWLITVRGGSGIEELRSDFLVDATGRSATVARAIGARRQRLDRLCGVSAVIPSSVKSQILIVEATAYGWWYAIPTPDCGTFVCLISDVDIVRAYGAVCPSVWLGLLKGVKSISQDFRHFPSSVSLRVQPCETTSLDRMIGNGWLAVGDAATSFDPLSSMGIEQALRAGREAASAISGYLGGSVAAVKLYAEKQVDIFQNYVTARRRHYREEMRWLSQAFWARRQEVKRGLPLGHGLESNKSSAA